MKTIEFELERRIQAPIDEVFARLVDIEGHNEWMPEKGSIRKHTTQTSPGVPTVGTTYVDETTQGAIPGEILELRAPNELAYHWWDKSKSGKLRSEGWPGYSLQSSGEHATLVRHHAKMSIRGVYQLAAPIFRRIAVRERTVTIDALKASFDTSKDSRRA
jgi:uncharacterized protein YndB with AHSA1/START domain